jgi:RNA polymerase sigma factor (TIGR02999 family)
MSTDPAATEVTVLLHAASSGDPQAAARLLPVLYDELRRLARDRMRATPPGNTLEPTALVHEAYLRLIGAADPGWSGRAHFFGAAARAMRDILVEQARRKAALKHGAGREHAPIDEAEIALEQPVEDIAALDAALRRLETRDPSKAELVMLRCFAGLTAPETAAALGVSERTIEREWRYTKAWLQREIDSAPHGGRSDG